MDQAVGTAMTAVDDQVVERTRAGDAGAWRALVDAHLPLVRAICTAYGLDEPASAGVNQVVWLRLAEHLPHSRTPEAIGGWVAAVTRGECLDPRRAGARSGWIVATIDPQVADPVAFVEAVGVAAAFGRLGARCQRLLRLLLTVPRPSDDHVSAALDIAATEIDTVGARCLDRLCRMLGADHDSVRATLQELVVAAAAIPGAWRDASGVAFSWMTLEAARADVVYDSCGPARQPGAERGLTELPRRHLRCATGPDSIDLTLEASDDEVLVTGRLSPARSARVTARWPDGTSSTGSDDRGAFRLDRLPRAPLSLHIDGPTALKTGWIVP
jgi:DNA-directed RNA polymerase specialized sigma24 family protein